MKLNIEDLVIDEAIQIRDGLRPGDWSITTRSASTP